MRWPWQKPTDHGEAEAAVENAHRNLAESRARWPAVSKAEEEIKRFRRENHFAVTIKQALRGDL